MFRGRLSAQSRQRFQRRGGGVMRDWTGTAQTRMREEFQLRGRWWNQAHGQCFCPARPDDGLRRQRFAFFQGPAQSGDIPTGGRNGAESGNKNSAHAHLRKIRLALTPPKPKELDSTRLTRASCI